MNADTNIGEAPVDSGIPWVGLIPAGWSVKPLFALGTESNLRNTGLAETNLLSLSYGNIIRKDINAVDGLLPASFDTYQIVHKGDIVFRLTDLQNDKRSLRSGLVHERGIITSAYLAFSPKVIRSDYLAYLMRSYDITKVFYSYGGGLRQSLKYEELRRMPILVPPTAEQSRIASFLDRETPAIDALISKQEQLIATLQEQRGAVADQLLNAPGGVQPLKRMVADVTVGIVVTPSAWYAEGEDGVPALRGINIRPGLITTEDLVHLTHEGDALHSKSRLCEGDVVMVRTGQAGSAAVVPRQLSGANAIDLLIVRPGHKADPDFLVAYFNAPSTREKIAHGSVGAIQGHFNVSALRDLEFPAIDIAEQRRRAEEWSVQSGTVDALIVKAQQVIEVLKEYRSALITDAVTGQIDVRGAA